MLEILSANKRELEKELRERVLTFFADNNEAPESVSVNMQLTYPTQVDEPPIIKILIKDRSSGETLHEALTMA